MIEIKKIYEMIAHHYLNSKRVTNVENVEHGEKLLILATGNSARPFWGDKAVRDKFADYDILIMNRSIYKMKELVYELKPKYFALCDPIYWGGKNSIFLSDNIKNETYEKTRQIFENVNWNCYLLTTIHECFDFNNHYVKILRMNATEVNEDKKIDYRLYCGNYANPGMHNVAQLAIYGGITLGYKKIGILGMDFDFIKNIHCDENCNLWDYADHQYDDGENDKIITYLEKEKKGSINGSVLANYLYEYYRTVSTFGKLRMYANEQKCEIINYCIESMLDCFKKERL